MKFFAFRSIRTRIMAGATLLSIALVGSVVSVWAKTESHLYRQEKLNEAKLFSRVLSTTLFSNHLAEKNWSQIRLNLDLLMKENKDFVYILVSDARMDNQIVGASLRDFQGQYIPDIVPLYVTNIALNLSEKPSIVDTFVLRDIQFLGMMRAKQGDRVMEVASDIQTVTGKKIGTLRFGISLRQVDRVVAYAVNQALMVGAVGLGIGLPCAYILAMRLSKPILELQMSAIKIAAGDLQHRAQIDSVDEIGILAASFNEMTAALQGSFSKLQRTLESFERFVPNKFISAIAPDGIENIHVGVAVKRNMTILFCDIRGYTSMSEVMTPLETFAFLNDYLACMAKAIDQAGGFIDKYIGDAIMALFDDEATDGALKAASLMQEALSKFNYERSQNSLPKIAVGIGIHRGEVVMGTVGYACRIDSTVVGDAVNIASRIEGLTKQYNCGILVTESVVSSLKYPELFALKLIDNAVKVKGKDEAIAIYELQI
ncbi:adenylate/guanylate cyclase [Tolypothrix sp. NIES-4075]|uniref:adenylate/guanylate cyclase domain-containing protein n=1 Tax=Tolypothrix sp. NIES-4075 TaxID=2005459 RepID=UPI000B5C87E0|nr:adenylate/guanylate cyclase domain-containing protein [Tolypothrix sp. NIES-4075]GAX40426.1 adenylate/guanylate cyclase [Tolypothrix sp. NIES-4075]